MGEPIEILGPCRSVLIIDWPSADVPDSLVRSGREVVVKGGPGPRDYAVRRLRDGEIVAQPASEPPAQIDLVYAHRPLSELPGIVALARRLGARAVWRQSGLGDPETRDPKGCWVSAEESLEAREIAESAGLRYVEDAYIGDVARELGGELAGQG
jgi:CoA binding domain